MNSQEIIFYLVISMIILFVGYLIGIAVQKLKSRQEFADKLPEIRKDAIKQSRAVLSGQFSEQIAPFLPDFPYNPTEVRFIGKPIDFIVFNGMDNKQINEVVFVEVKSGDSRMNPVEKSLKEAVISRKVIWKEYRIPESVVK